MFSQEEAEEKPEEVEEEKEEPLDLSWPDTWRSRFVYVLLAPLLYPLALTTPDVRKPVSTSFDVSSTSQSALHNIYIYNFTFQECACLYLIPELLSKLNTLCTYLSY